MKFVTYQKGKEQKVGIFYNDFIFDLQNSAKKLKLILPSTMKEFLEGGKSYMRLAQKVFKEIKSDKIKPTIKRNRVKLHSPVPNPTSMRDGYAFRQHVETARRNRGVPMIPEFDQYPVFYFTNHNAVFGEGIIEVEDDHLQQLDFELECAIVIGKKGKNIPAEKADQYIAGYMIMNDWSARVLQMEEMKLNLGPAKGKDFATSLGPWLVTVDELEQYKISTPFGNKYDLRMVARHNGKQISDGNLKDMNWTFAELIERASYGVTLFPGDVIGSGTVGTGCYLELNGTWILKAKARGENFTSIWLNDGDEMELEITGLGVLKNKIRKSKNNYSILKKKKSL
ncbi:fumarylacetoacetate hydrolase family protein [Ignavibacterium sp.]|uniref:fumarylacetoacetate hydrolase family protein n=1 Tax=Ignavibacterium sp. TaxID=2651167 RepID=UPI00307DB6FD